MNWKTEWENAVWEHAPDRNALTVLLALGRCADWSTGARCFPGLDHLAKLARVSPDTVRRTIAQLEADGWVTLVRTPGKSHYYRLDNKRLKPDPLHPATPCTLQGVAPCDPVQGASTPLAPCDPTPSTVQGDHNQYLNQYQNAGEGAAPAGLATHLRVCFEEGGRKADDATCEAVAQVVLTAAGGDEEVARRYCAAKARYFDGRAITDSGALKALAKDAAKGCARAAAELADERRRANTAAKGSTSDAGARPVQVAYPDQAPPPEARALRACALRGLFGGDT